MKSRMKLENYNQTRIVGADQIDVHLAEISKRILSKRELKMAMYKQQAKLSHGIIELGNEIRELESKLRKAQQRGLLREHN